MRVQPTDLFARFLTDVGTGAQMLGAFRPLAVPMRVVAGEHDEVGSEHIDHAGQDRFLRLTGHPDVAGPQVVVRIATPAALDPVATLLVVLVQPIDEERDPAGARLEEGDPQLWMPLEDAARDERGHRRHLVERKADAVHLDVIRETVHADLRQMNAGRTVNAQRHPELDGRGVERVEIGVVEVAGLERRRDQSRDQPQLLGFAHDVDGHLSVFDRGDTDAAQPAIRRRTIIRDPLVVEPGESRSEIRVFEAGHAQPEAGIEHHRFDVIAVGVAHHTLGRPAVDVGRLGDPVLGRTAGPGALVFRVIASFKR